MSRSIRLISLFSLFLAILSCNAKMGDRSSSGVVNTMVTESNDLNIFGCFTPYHETHALEHLCLMKESPAGARDYLAILKVSSEADNTDFIVNQRFRGRILARSEVTLKKIGEKSSLDSSILSQGVVIGTFHDFAYSPIIIEICDLSVRSPSPTSTKKKCHIATQSDIQGFRSSTAGDLASAIRWDHQ